MNTPTDNQTASAPETRKITYAEYVDAITQLDAIKKAKRKKRTIPAEKPTAQNWRQARLEELQDWYLSACKGRQEANTQVALLQAHADKLAEALNSLDMAHDHKTLVVAKQNARQALAAYKSEVR